MEQVFNQITNSINESSNVIIMSHQMIDYDGFGSAIALTNICKHLNKEAHIYLNLSKVDSINPYLFKILENHKISYINIKNYKEYINDNTLLIVVDTHSIDMVENKNILHEIENIIVIDHHLKSNNPIQNTKITYIDSNLSSVNEFLTFYIHSLNFEPAEDVVTTMLMGIELDTNNFKTKTTAQTFKAASILVDKGANLTLVNDLVKEEKEQTLKRVKYLTNSYTYKDKIMICPIKTEIVEDKDISIVSDLQLTFKNIKIVFTIGKTDPKTIKVSARSTNEYDVEGIMKKLGGGGHATKAATTITGKSVDEAEDMIMSLIKEVL
jgi:c-di-AMP phosphodiesterase-like protein